MARRTPSEVYAALVRAGFSPPAAVIMTAIAGGESGWDDAAVGDVGLQDNTWGPSVGAFQIRTVKRETGSRSIRDIVSLQSSLDAQAAAAFEISRQGKDFTPWSVYTSGKYQQFLGQTNASVGGTPSLTDAGSSPLNALLPDPSKIIAKLRDIGVEGIVVVLGLALIGAGLAAAVSPRFAATARKVLP